MLQNTEINIKNRIYGHGKGWCFTVGHFSDLGNHEAVKKALQRLQQSGLIRRVSRGLYDYPRQHEKLGTLPPDVDLIAKAIAQRYGVRIQQSGAYAANAVGFSEQVPARVVYVTDGVPKKVKIGKLEINFRRTTPQNTALAGTKMGLLIQALRHFGEQRIDEKMEQTLKRHLDKIAPQEIKKALKYAPIWVRELINRLLKEEK
ncbi:MAG TPA: hypothetical protein DDW49_11825 [Deltaproteobacteria bacterium]|nr:MAG: hypothetical protein A2048_02650 [Deltaproteobacteria bacterium GWA2_45_12]HBF14053.1 hypothetical protein [Deltaproteobacteria bacterium]